MTPLIAAMLGNDPEMIRRWHTSALFRANIITIAQHVIPATVLGLAVQCDRDATVFERNLVLAQTTVAPLKLGKEIS